MKKFFVFCVLFFSVFFIFNTTHATEVRLPEQGVTLEWHDADFGDYGINWDFSLVQPFGIAIKRKLEGDYMRHLPVRSFYFPVKIWATYDAEKAYPGNILPVTVFLQPYDKNGLTEYSDEFGNQASIGYYTKSRYPCWPEIFCWGPWLGASVGYDLGIDMKKSSKPSMKGLSEVEFSDTQTTGFSDDLFGIELLSLSVKTRTTEKFSNGKFFGDLYFLEPGESYMDVGSFAKLDTSSMAITNRAEGIVSKSFNVTVPKDVNPGETMNFGVPNLRYTSDYYFYIGVLPQISLWEPSESAPLYDDTVTLTSEQKNFFFPIKVAPKPIVKPIVDAGPDITVQIGERINLVPANATDPDGRIVKYNWKGGGVINANTQTASADSEQWGVGTYSIVLTVTDNDEATAKDTVNVTVTDLPPKPDILVSSNQLHFGSGAIAGKPFTVRASICNEGTGPATGFMNKLSYKKKNASNWTAGSEQWIASLARFECKDKTWTFTVNETGSYDFKMELDNQRHQTESDENNNTFIDSVNINDKVNQPPVASFKILDTNKKTGSNGQAFWLIDTILILDPGASSDDNKIGTYVWDFGDGTYDTKTSAGQVMHTYAGNGKYKIKLIVADEGGFEDDAEQYVTVMPSKPEFIQPADAEIANKAILLKWKPISDKNADYFQLKYTERDETKKINIPANQTQILLTDLISSHEYNFSLYIYGKERNDKILISDPAEITVKTKASVPNLVVARDIAGEQQDITGQVTGGGASQGVNQGGQAGLATGSTGGFGENMQPKKIYFEVVNNGTAGIYQPAHLYYSATYASKDDSSINGSLTPTSGPNGYISIISGAGYMKIGESRDLVFNLPPQPGRYEVCLKIDSQNAVSELNENDNKSCFDYIFKLPDMAVERDSFGGSGTTNPGASANIGGGAQVSQSNQQNTFYFKIKNTGIIPPSAAVAVKAYYYPKMADESSAKPLDGPTEVKILGPNAYTVAKYTVGEFNDPQIVVCLQADPQKKISELSKENNLNCFIYSKSLPNIKIATVGNSTIYRQTIGNDGKIKKESISLGSSNQSQAMPTQTSGNGVDKAMFQITNNGSKDITGDIKLNATITSGDNSKEVYELNGPAATGGLKVNEVKYLDYVIPADLKENQEYYLRVEADPEGNINESNKIDNIISISYTKPAQAETDTAKAAGLTPKSPFYGLKRVVENIQTILTIDPQKKIDLQLRLAQERMAEAQQMAKENEDSKVKGLIDESNANISNAKKILTDIADTDDGKISVASEKVITSLGQQENTLNKITGTSKNVEIQKYSTEVKKQIEQKQESILQIEESKPTPAPMPATQTSPAPTSVPKTAPVAPVAPTTPAAPTNITPTTPTTPATPVPVAPTAPTTITPTTPTTITPTTPEPIVPTAPTITVPTAPTTITPTTPTPVAPTAPTTITPTTPVTPTAPTTQTTVTPAPTPAAAKEYYCQWSWPQKIIDKNSKAVIYSCTSARPYCNYADYKYENVACCKYNATSKVYSDCLTLPSLLGQ